MNGRYQRFLGVCLTTLLSVVFSANAAPEGFVEGQLRIVAGRAVQLDATDSEQSKEAAHESYPNYPLVVVTQGEKKQVARFTADAEGKYRVALPPGNYVLDVEGRVSRRLRAKPQPFTISPNLVSHVDLTVLTGLAEE